LLRCHFDDARLGFGDEFGGGFHDSRRGISR
jgi:hypothetical protein